MTREEIKALARELREAKEAENAARGRRIALEAKLAEAVGVPEQWTGTKTQNLDEIKIIVRRAIDTRINNTALKDVIAAGPEEVREAAQTAFYWAAKVREKQWNALPDDIKSAFAPAVERSMGKTGITVEIREEKE